MGKSKGNHGASPPGDSDATAGDPDAGRLFERTSELQQIESALGQLHVGVGGCVLIRGRTGTGKTRLMRAAVDSARATDLPCWYGSGSPTWRGEPLLVLRETLGREGSPMPVPQGRSALLDAIENAVAWVPHLLAIDNFDTADPATLSALGELAEHIQQFPLLLLLAYRPDRLPELPRGFERATTLDLRPLTAPAAAELAQHLMRAPVGPALRAALAGAGGSPLRIRLWLEDLQARGALVRHDGAVDLRDPAQRPPSTGDLSRARNRRLVGRDTIDLLRVVAVIGRGFRLEDLAELAGQPPETVAARLQSLLDLGAATRDGAWWQIRWTALLHNLYAETSGAERTRLHRAYAHVLEERHESPVLVAEHLLAADEPGDRQAVAAARRGAAAVLERAPETSAHLLRQAMRLLSAGDGERNETVVELVEAEVAAGDLDRAQKIGEQGLEEIPVGPVRARLELALLSAYEVGGGLETLATAVLSRPQVDDHLRRAVLARRALERVASGQLDDAVSAAQAVLAEHPQPRDEASSVAVTALAWAETTRGDPEEALRLIRDPAAAPVWGRGAGLASLREGLALDFLNRFDEALEVFYSRLRELDRAGWPARLRPILLVGIADVHYGQGAWDEALAEWETVIAGPSSGVLSAAGRARLMRALVAAHRGDVEPARELRLARARAGRQARSEELEVEAILLESEGDAAAAYRVAQQVWAEHLARGAFGRLPFTVPWAIRFARGAGMSDAELLGLVAPMTGRLVELARQWSTDSVVGAAALARGVRDRNAAALAQAVQRFRSSARASDHCVGLEVCGEELVRAGQRDLGIEALLEALDFYRTLGAGPRAEHLLVRLRELGVRRGLRRPRGRPDTGWESLSDEELTVAALVSTGFSNPRIAHQMGLPGYRVSALIEGVLSKLGVASRLHLGLLVARRARGLEPGPQGAAGAGAETSE